MTSGLRTDPKTQLTLERWKNRRSTPSGSGPHSRAPASAWRPVEMRQQPATRFRIARRPVDHQPEFFQFAALAQVGLDKDRLPSQTRHVGLSARRDPRARLPGRRGRTPRQLRQRRWEAVPPPEGGPRRGATRAPSSRRPPPRSRRGQGHGPEDPHADGEHHRPGRRTPAWRRTPPSRRPRRRPGAGRGSRSSISLLYENSITRGSAALCRAGQDGRQLATSPGKRTSWYPGRA